MAPILILDGGLGTSLEQRHGIRFSHDSTPLWSSHLLVSDPDTLAKCQAEFGRVPVDILLTATYQLSEEGFARTRHPSGAGVAQGDVAAEPGPAIEPAQIPEFIETAIRIAEAARQDGTRIALSLGPYGACMTPSQEYSGRYDAAHDSADALRAWHSTRMQLFRDHHDLQHRLAFVALETVPRVDEIEAMRRSLAATPALSGIPFWISCLYPSGETLPDGSTPEDAIRAMLDPAVAPARPWGIGINCTKVDRLGALVRRYEAAVRRMLREGILDEWPALVLYPDGTNGEVFDAVTQTWVLPAGEAGRPRIPWERQLADVVWAAEKQGWRQVVVGGCCMAGVDDIARLRRLLMPESHDSSSPQGIATDPQ
ncbi:hypothetical protein HIM_05763 [Hirsutella minnesotensis 3608]|uniref:Hcy-binding domain-containing protein n=1 Tax=Hirsutella minnesotensis 3608 TaxID=1043627 RepID=A0A0F8A578_9HYPO|nr:hypothetical protein HIM_05763 [Hirsutella minnesotensis 3608]